jgi:cation diffusion facilitator family transporter
MEAHGGSQGEQRDLSVSVYGALFFAVLGIAIALYVRSNALLLDGGYSFISAAMAFAGLLISRRIGRRPSRSFPFGYHAFEPLFIFLKGCLILIAASAALWSSVQSIVHGGTSVDVPVVLAYLVFSVVACFGVAVFLRRRSKSRGSGLLLAESTSWLIDGAISVGALVAFSLALPLEGSSHARWIPYIDPILTIVIVLCLISEPIKLVRAGLLDILRAAPPASLLSSLQETVDPLCAEHGFARIDLRAHTMGRAIFVQLICRCPPEIRLGSVKQLDAMRQGICACVRHSFPHAEVDVVVTGEEKR